MRACLRVTAACLRQELLGVYWLRWLPWQKHVAAPIKCASALVLCVCTCGLCTGFLCCINYLDGARALLVMRCTVSSSMLCSWCVPGLIVWCLQQARSASSHGLSITCAKQPTAHLVGSESRLWLWHPGLLSVCNGPKMCHHCMWARCKNFFYQ